MDSSTDFIGRGWTFPPSVDSRGRIALTLGTNELDAAIRMILLTAPGERVMRPEFGCRAWDYLFQPLDPNTLGMVEAAVEDALRRWEPRIAVERVTASEDETREGSIAVEVEYAVKETNDRRNLVVPFYEIGQEP